MPLVSGIIDRREAPMEQKSDLSALVRSLVLPMGLMTALCWVATLPWGFSLPTLIGFAVGYGYVLVCYFYLARSCERAVELDVKKGKQVMLVCYLVRFAGLFALCAVSMLTKYINVIGVLVPQFFPRIVLTVKQFASGKER